MLRMRTVIIAITVLLSILSSQSDYWILRVSLIIKFSTVSLIIEFSTVSLIIAVSLIIEFSTVSLIIEFSAVSLTDLLFV